MTVFDRDEVNDYVNKDLYKAQQELGNAKAALDRGDLESVYGYTLSAIDYLETVKVLTVNVEFEEE